MKTLKFTYLPLLLLLLWCDRCESTNDSSSLPAIFFPFGSEEGDGVVSFGFSTCDGPIDIPYNIFTYTTLYVSNAHAK